MTPRRMLRPALLYVAVLCGGATLASCSGVDSDANRFEGMAQHVSNIRLDGAPETGSKSGHGSLLRPAIRSKPQPLKVQIMDPHDLWDARDGGLRGAVGQIGGRVAEAAAPVVAEVAVQRGALHMAGPAPMRPAIEAEPAEVVLPAPRIEPVVARTAIQLGAYSSPESARLAWAKVSTGAASSALSGLSPVYETVNVNGRSFTRLKIAAPAAAAAAICQAAAVSDPWCARRA